MVDDVDRAIARAAGLPAPPPSLPAALRPDPFALARRLTAPFGPVVAGAVDALAPPEPAP
jgi:hypothetical protein